MRLLPLFKRKLSRREWNLLFIYVIILIGSLGFTLIENFSSEVKNLREEIEVKKTKLIKLKRFIVYRKKDIEKRYKDLSFIKSKTDFNEFVQTIEELATTAGISIINIRPLSTEEERKYKIYSLILEGEMERMLNLAKFLYLAKDLTFPLKVNYVSIAPSKEGFLKISLYLKAVSFSE